MSYLAHPFSEPLLVLPLIVHSGHCDASKRDRFMFVDGDMRVSSSRHHHQLPFPSHNYLHSLSAFFTSLNFMGAVDHDVDALDFFHQRRLLSAPSGMSLFVCLLLDDSDLADDFVKVLLCAIGHDVDDINSSVTLGPSYWSAVGAWL
ncbi:hypothetical protein BDZ89DRAFT_1151194 [Hymenopellis radicata]|nr:hypothetical protein BDZ89DRAFT_1151834 [Hymenopellis radicata]KAF8992201.1 hypothetical protein BDZ89DRAFT_1151194 [Hymenopellis radicata]